MKNNKNDEGKFGKFVLPGPVFYQGIILEDTELFYIIKDRFGGRVRITKAHLLSVEIRDDD